MRLARRALLLVGACAPCAARAAAATPRALVFPRDHGAHPEFGIEWWYVTGWLRRAEASAPGWGFQLTFFRSRTALRGAGRFAAPQLLFAHAALTDLSARRLRHAERIVRWNEDPAAPRGAVARDDTHARIGAWSLVRAADGAYRAVMADDGSGFGLRLSLTPTQPLLLQGDAGFSRKGPRPNQASHYVSEPQLEARGELSTGPQRHAVQGRAWLDHEWSSSLLPEGAVGWDWIGINLDDGAALTVFRLRDPAGRPLWAGGSHRTREGALRVFGPEEVRFEALAWWDSAATRARYPVHWRIDTPAGAHELRALLDAQELDARASTGTVYWEGLSELRAPGGTRLGLGYLEMTGYGAPLRLQGP